ncbi:MAG: type II secretion system protein [Bdellovibrionaceae bacterium]|nr:type II secretion system protein [Pseudobdellovibrionaceae bacterium]MBX3033477.1 type II secretion system protein [Pseudobdellovibrionaceae bacterium]
MRSRRRGFTLLEILLAMVILASGVVLLANSWSGSFMRIRKTQTNTEVAALLERKMTEIDLKYRGKPLESIEEEVSDDFGSDYPDYRWEMKSKEFELPDLSTGLTSQEGGASEMLITVMKTMSEHLKKTIKEVKVSVFHKTKGGKELEYSVTTFFVDYNKELPLPGGM